MKRLVIIILLGMILVGCSEPKAFSIKSTSLIGNHKELHELLGQDYLLPTNVFELSPQQADKDIVMRIYDPKGKEIISVVKSDVLPDYQSYDAYNQYIVLNLSYIYNNQNEKKPYTIVMSIAYVIETPEPKVLLMEKSISTEEFVGSMLNYSLENPVLLEDDTEYVLAFTGLVEGIYQVDSDGVLNVYNPWDYGEGLYVLTIEFFD